MAYYSDGTKMIEGGAIKAGLDTPVWQTSASLGNIYSASRANGGGITFSATSTTGLTVSYEHVGGTLPPGSSLSGNALTGTINSVSSDTTYTFTIRAKTLLTADRQFTVTIKAPVVSTYNYTGSNQTFSVPSGVNYVEAVMWGAAGGFGAAEGYADSGGPGGYSTGTINVSSISTLIVQVGQGGSSGNGGRPSRAYPNGGLGSVRGGYTNGSGGGRTGIFNGSVSHGNSIMIAGGGGGGAGHGGGGGQAGSNMSGGSGGGSSGEAGWGYGNAAAGPGGTQSAGGSVSSPSGRPNGRSGAALQGGDAGDGQHFSTGYNAAGGGGDGYYGGGCKDDVHGGGGGGSGYLHPSLVTNGTTSANTSSSGKKTSRNPAGTGNSYWSSGIGVGYNNASGGNGKCVIIY